MIFSPRRRLIRSLGFTALKWVNPGVRWRSFPVLVILILLLNDFLVFIMGVALIRRLAVVDFDFRFFDLNQEAPAA